MRSALGNKDNKSGALTSPKLKEYSWLVFSDEDMEAESEKRIKKAALLAAVVLALGAAVFAAVWAMDSKDSPSLEELLRRRDEPHDAELSLEMEYRGLRLEKDMTLEVSPQEVTAERAEALFDACEAWIMERQSEGLCFPEEGPGGVIISWQNSDFSYIGIDGPQERSFIAQLGAGEYSRVSEFSVLLDPSEEDYLRSMEAAAEKLREELGRNGEGESLALPPEEDGVELGWSAAAKKAPAAVLALAAFAALFIWMGRNDPLERMMKKRKRSFENELPNMIFRMILFLNAGLIAESAFSQLVEQTRESIQPLYRAMRDIKAASLKKNVSFVSELSDYAGSSGCPELVRFAAMAEEHAGRGSELADKLEKERLQMRSARVLGARAKVKEAETRLCFPLVLLLLALILITASPSFLAM